MKKKLLSSILAATMVVSLAACGSASSDTTATTTETGDTQTAEADTTEAAATTQTASGDGITITMWTNDRHDMDYIQSAIDTFNSTNTDGITVEFQTVTDNYANQIQLAYQGGTAPDIVTGNGSDISINNFADTGIVIPLNDYISADEEYQKVNDPYNHMYEGYNVKDGNIYSVYSGVRSGVRVEYNTSLITEEIPSTLSDYVALAQKVTDEGAGQYYGIGLTSSGPFGRLLEASAQMSGIYPYDYVNGKFDFSGFKEIVEVGKGLVAAAYPDQQGVDNMRALFAEGQFALWSNASQEVSVFTNQIPVTGFEWGVAEVPTLDGTVKGALNMVPQKGYYILSSSPNQDAAWKVISYLQSEEVMKSYLENGYCLPITDYMAGIIDSSQTGRMVDFATQDYEDVYPPTPSINLTGDDYGTVLWNAVMGYVDVDEAIEDLNTRYNEALEADVASGTVKRLVIKDYDPLHPSKGTAEYLSE